MFLITLVFNEIYTIALPIHRYLIILNQVLAKYTIVHCRILPLSVAIILINCGNNF